VIIGELSARSGVSPRSLRYYEQQGLLSSTRAANGYRHYDEDAVEVAKRIRTMYEIGFSTDVVRQVLPCATGRHDLVDRAVVRSHVEEMRDSLAARVDELARTRDTLTEYLDGPGLAVDR
jgi:DNA-binding transcriptional MerR regulator